MSTSQVSSSQSTFYRKTPPPNKPTSTFASGRVLILLVFTSAILSTLYFYRYPLNLNFSAIETHKYFICSVRQVRPCYMGDVENGKPEGVGKMLFPDNRRYEGDFKDGKPHGKGIETIQHSTTTEQYQGSFQKGKRDGEGKVFVDGVKVYEGGFKDGQRQGMGVELENGFVVYKGEFEHNKRKGLGTEYQRGRRIYYGQFKNGKRHGKGVEFYESGASRLGVWKEGEWVQGFDLPKGFWDKHNLEDYV